MSISSVFLGHSQEETREGMGACVKAWFPICLCEGMLRMFGEKGKKALDSIVMNETFENTPITSPKDIRDLYEKYMERVANLLGDSVARVVEFQSLKEMQSEFCVKCPLYERELKRKVSSETPDLPSFRVLN